MLPLTAVYKFLGRKVFSWLIISVIASCSLAITDYGFASLLEILLKALRLANINENSSRFFVLSESVVLNLLLFLLLIGITRGLSQFFVFHSIEVIYESVNTRLRLFSLHEILKRHSQKFVSAAQINLDIGEVFPKASFFCWQGSTLLSYLFQLFILLVAMFYTAWRETIIGLVGLGFIVIVTLKLNRKVRTISKKIPTEQEALVKGIQRIARNWLLVRALRTSDKEYNLLLNKSLSYYSYFLKAKFLGNLTAVIPISLGAFILVIIFSANLTLWTISPQTLIAFLFLYSRFLSTLTRVGRGFGLTNSNYSYFKIAVLYVSKFTSAEENKIEKNMRLVNLLGKYVNITRKPEENILLESTQKSAETTPPEIKIENLSFSYNLNSARVINQLSFTINAGEQFGIIGKSGSGKSTLLGLILGVIEPLEGKITIAGLSPEDFLKKPSNPIGYVGAESFLIEGTIKENLDYGALRNYDRKEYYQALQAAHLLELVESLPQKLDYWLNENGEGLSAGQQQRLCLARAFLRKPQLLILDEASANLDDETESKITTSLQQIKGGCTIIIVSHRPGILKCCDQIFDLSTFQFNQKNNSIL